jgi:hypothetical protein
MRHASGLFVSCLQAHAFTTSPPHASTAQHGVVYGSRSRTHSSRLHSTVSEEEGADDSTVVLVEEEQPKPRFPARQIISAADVGISNRRETYMEARVRQTREAAKAKAAEVAETLVRSYSCRLQLSVVVD